MPSSGPNYVSYRAYRVPWSGLGAGAPALATERTPSGTTAYVSWNGDTRVSRWVAMAGTSPSTLSAIGERHARGLRDGDATSRRRSRRSPFTASTTPGARSGPPELVSLDPARMKVEGAPFIVTGAASGLGAATAQALAAAGAQLLHRRSRLRARRSARGGARRQASSPPT